VGEEREDDLELVGAESVVVKVGFEKMVKMFE
jgi:hypothetical protein